MGKYIGANYVHGARFGGIQSSFDKMFEEQQVLIGSGLDYIPCVIGDINDAYQSLKDAIEERQPENFEALCACVFSTIHNYFGDYSNISERLKNYPDLDFISDGVEIGKVSNLKGKNAAMCVERAMLAQNLLKFLGITSVYKSSGIIKNGNKEVHSYNLVENGGKYYIFDATMPDLINEEINPLVGEIPKEVFDEISSPLSNVGYSVEVAHYNPLRSEEITVVYDAGRVNKFVCSNNNIVKAM